MRGGTRGIPQNSFLGTLEKGAPRNVPSRPKKVTNATPQKCVFEQPYGKNTNQDIINLVDIFAGANQSDIEPRCANMDPSCAKMEPICIKIKPRWIKEIWSVSLHGTAPPHHEAFFQQAKLGVILVFPRSK